MCVASISHLGFLVATWVLDPFLLHLFMQDLSITNICTNWARLLSALGCGSIRPISWRSVNLDFYPLQLPPQPMGSSSLSGRTRGVTVQGSGDDSSKICESTVSIWML